MLLLGVRVTRFAQDKEPRMDTSNFSPSAAIAMGALFVAAIALIVLLSGRSARAQSALRREAEQRGWTFTKGNEGDTLVWTVEDTDGDVPWRIEKRTIRDADSSAHGSNFIAYWISPVHSIDSGALQITPKLPIASDFLQKSLGGNTDNNGGPLTRVDWGSEAFRSRFVVMASEPALVERLGEGLESVLLERLGSQDSGSVVISRSGPIAVTLDTEGLIVRWSELKTKIEAYDELVGFGLSVARNLSS